MHNWSLQHSVPHFVSNKKGGCWAKALRSTRECLHFRQLADLPSNDIFSVWYKEIVRPQSVVLSWPPVCSNLDEGLISQRDSSSQQWPPKWALRPSKTSWVNPLSPEPCLKYACSNAQVMKGIWRKLGGIRANVLQYYLEDTCKSKTLHSIYPLILCLSVSLVLTLLPGIPSRGGRTD